MYNIYNPNNSYNPGGKTVCMYVYVYVWYVCMREREREREGSENK